MWVVGSGEGRRPWSLWGGGRVAIASGTRGADPPTGTRGSRRRSRGGAGQSGVEAAEAETGAEEGYEKHGRFLEEGGGAK